MYRYSEKTKKDDIVQICRVNSILAKNVNSQLFIFTWNNRLLQTATLCLQYTYHFLPDGNSYAQAHIHYEKGLLYELIRVTLLGREGSCPDEPQGYTTVWGTKGWSPSGPTKSALVTWPDPAVERSAIHEWFY